MLSNGLINPQRPPDLFAYSDKDCIACRKSQNLIAEYAKGGWSLKMPSARIENAGLATPATAEKVIINFTVVEDEQPYYKNGEKSGDVLKAVTVKKGAALKWENGAWRMFGIENL